MENYCHLVKKKTFIGNQPVALSSKTFHKNEKYFITHKLDGLRELLFLNCDKSCSVSTVKMIFKKFTATKAMCKFAELTLLDTEYYKRKWYVFDILFYKGTDVRSEPLSMRLKILDKLIKQIKSARLLLKPYISPYTNPSLYKNFTELVEKYSKQMRDGPVDGIIFAPDKPYYDTVLKWKPPHLLSIDFKIEKQGDGIIHLLTQKRDVFTSKYFKNIGVVKVSPGEYRKFKDGDVVEFIFENRRFVPLRIRHDKEKSNHISVILSNFNEIIHPTNMRRLLR